MHLVGNFKTLHDGRQWKIESHIKSIRIEADLSSSKYVAYPGMVLLKLWRVCNSWQTRR